jgi:hypothetical protein
MLENFWEVVSLLATCCKEKQVGMREEREDRGGWVVSAFPFYFHIHFFKIKYLENHKFKL